jgi:hypothetical protein
MAFKASDYPEIRNASEAYDVARAEFQRLDRQLNETSTSSPTYKDLVTRRNEAKQEMDTALKKYQDITKKRKAEFEADQKKKADRKKSETLKRKLKTLKDDRQRALDRGDSTDAVDNAIKKAQDELDKITADRKKTAEAPGRPDGVPASATFSAVTGQWTLGNKKWDSKGKAITTTPKGPTGPTGDTGDGKGKGPTKVTGPTGAPIATTATGPVPTTATTADFDKVLAQAQATFGGIDELFKTNEELRSLLTRAVGDPNKIGDEFTVERFISELENTNWFKTNAGPIRQRGFYQRQYDALKNKLKLDDPNYKEKLAELDRTSEFGRGLVDTIQTVNEYVTQLLGFGALDDATVRSIASDIYLYANEDDAVKIRNAVLAAAKFGPGRAIGGQAAETLADLKTIAGANGFDLEAQFKTELPTWLDRIAKGESPEVYKKIIRDAAKAAYNVSDRVGALMDQGVDLDTIYSPYRNVMASILEVNPRTVTLKDLSEKGVFGGKQEMNLYDFQKTVRRDPRWQYTQNARDDMANTALTLLRNFGFQG